MTFRYVLEKTITPNYLMRKAGRDHNLSPHFTPYQWNLKEGESPYLNPFFPGRLEFSALRCALQSTRDAIENIRYYEGYAEPGYTDPTVVVLVTNWNDLPDDRNLLEKMGCAVEWEDEWTDCCDCGKLVRTSPDSYSWQRHWVLLNECEVVCLDCLKEDRGYAEHYLRKLEDDADMAVMRQLDPTDYGYERVGSESHDYETGWHPGQNDSPAKVLEHLHSRGITRVVFQVSESSQFYSKWRAYAHPLRKGAVVRVKDENETYILMDAPRESGYVSGMDREGCEVSLDPDELEVVS